MAGRTLPHAVPAAWLRVYEPLEAFPKADRARWAQYAFRQAADTDTDTDADGNAAADRVERAVAWRRLLTVEPARDPVGGDGPSFHDLPGGSGDGSFLPVLPAADLDVPPALPARPGDAVDGPDGRTHAKVVRVCGGDPLICPVPAFDRSLTKAWALPTEWLLLGRAEDAVTGARPGHYLVPMARCRTRAARALRTVRRGLGEIPIAERLASTARWLEAFHPRSAVEIDLRSVTALVGEDGRDDVETGLAALAEGDAATIAAAYRRVRRREEILREISRAS